MGRYTRKKIKKVNKKKLKQRGGEASNLQRSFQSMGSNIFEMFKNNYKSTLEYANQKSQITQSNIKLRINNLKSNISRRVKCLTD